MLYELLSFIHKRKIILFKILSIISFLLIFVKPIYGFSMFITSIVLLAYSEQIMGFFDKL